MIAIEINGRPIPFSEFCMKTGAAVVALPTMLLGFLIGIAGLFAAIALSIPGVIAWALTKSIMNDSTAINVCLYVTLCIAILGSEIFSAGRKCGLYSGIIVETKSSGKPFGFFSSSSSSSSSIVPVK